MSTKNTDITVVIVAYNSQANIKECLDSIIKYSPGTGVVIVDNNSQDSTTEIVKKMAHVRIKLIEMDQNVGFGRGCNEAVQSIDDKYIVFLNPDTKLIAEDSLEKLRDALIGHPEYGLIGPQLLYLDGKARSTVRNLPTVKRAFREYLLGQKGAYDFYLPEDQNLTEVESVVGACFVIEKNVFLKAGGFDDKYFLYFEDLDLCRQIKKLGLKVGYLPQVKVEHIEGASGQGSGKTVGYLKDSAKKYHGLLSYYVIQFIIRLSRLKRMLGTKG